MDKPNLLAGVRVIDFQQFRDVNGVLTVFEAQGKEGIRVARAFWVSAAKGALRGDHAHLRCTQILVCMQGSCEVTVDDGWERKSVLLDDSNRGLLVPTHIWARELFLAENNLLLVLCDRPYEQEDYIRDYSRFMELRRPLTTSKGAR